MYGWIWNDILISGGTADQIHPQIAYSGQGHSLIVWENRENQLSDIYGIIENNGQTPPYPFQICTAPGDQRNPVVAWDGTNYLVAWQDTRSGNSSDISAVRVTPQSNVLEGNSAQDAGVAICTAINDQFHPSLVWGGKNYLLAWEDFRNNSGKIYTMRISKDLQLLDGSPTTGGLLIGGGDGLQVKPKVAWNGTNYFVVWESHKSESSSDIYGCRVSPSGQLLDTPGIGAALFEDDNIKLNPNVASDGEDFFVVWDAHNTGYADIIGLMVTDDGSLVTQGPFPIAEGPLDQLTPTIIWCTNHYMVLWKDTRNGKADLYTVRLNSIGAFLDAQTVSTGINLGLVGSSILGSPSAAVRQEDRDEYFIIWEEKRSDSFDIYSRRYDAIPPPLLTWTGETNYQNDGVNPDQSSSGTTFEFRVKYQNPNGLPPRKYQLWIDQDDDGTYFINAQNPVMDKIMNMSLESGSDYTQGVIYKAETTVEFAGDGKINYRFVFSDLTNEATGEPTKNHQILFGNTSASLEWMDTTEYESDGISPNSASGGSSFTFRVKYRDWENDPPTTSEVWIDLNHNNIYDNDEKFTMNPYDSQNFSAGRAYFKSLSCIYIPDLANTNPLTIKYRFYFTNTDEVAEGDPSNDHFFSVTPYLSVPLLSWPSEAGFLQGVRLKDETGDKNYEFCISYQDADNHFPTLKELWIDKNADSFFSQEEKYTMEEVNPYDNSVTDEKMYHLDITLSYYEEENIFYKFVFSDGWNMATGEPFINGSQINVNPSVYLTWAGDTGFSDDGIDPDSGPAMTWFHFRIKYTNINNFPPQTKEVWVDENNDGLYQSAEKHIMGDLNPNDLTYSDGKIYALDLKINPPSPPSTLSYTFEFRDAYLKAIGEPTTNSLTVLVLEQDPSWQDPNTVDPQPDPNEPNDQNRAIDPYTPQQLTSPQGGCFISSLLSYTGFR